jgi:hypothetical protein
VNFIKKNLQLTSRWIASQLADVNGPIGNVPLLSRYRAVNGTVSIIDESSNNDDNLKTIFT